MLSLAETLNWPFAALAGLHPRRRRGRWTGADLLAILSCGWSFTEKARAGFSDSCLLAVPWLFVYHLKSYKQEDRQYKPQRQTKPMVYEV